MAWILDGIICRDPTQHELAVQHARQLGCDLIEHAAGWALVIDTDAIYCAHPKHRPLKIDFLSAELQRRARQHAGEALIKACQPLDHSSHVIDATAGWGTDAWLLAQSGAQLTLCEQSPLMGILLADGIRRLAAVQSHRLTLITQKAQDHLADATGVDVVYLDPMYPTERKQSRARLPLQWLRDQTQDSACESDLLNTALATARHKVVVKRPHRGTHLNHQRPSFAISKGRCRFDVYLVTDRQ